MLSTVSSAAAMELNSTYYSTVTGSSLTDAFSVMGINASENSTSENSTSTPFLLPAYIRNTSMVVCILVMVLGVIGNLMVPIVVLRGKDMRNSTNIFLVNLSVADLCVLLVCAPTVLVEVNSRPEIWDLGEHMCKAVPFVELTVAHASVLTILAISFERYYAICEPLKAGYVCTKARATCLCLLAWAAAALITSPIILMSDYHMELYVDGSVVPVCRTEVETAWTTAFFVGSIVVFFFLPLFILIILYTVIARHLMANPMISRGPANNLLKYRKQVVLMLGTVVLSFFICLLPFRAMTLWIMIVPEETLKCLGIEGYYGIVYFCRIMLYLNSAVNPILYNLMSTKFREGFLKLCGFTIGKKAPGRSGTYTTGSTNCSSSNQSDLWRRQSSNKGCSLKASSVPMESQLRLPLLSVMADGIVRKKQESYV